MARTSLSFPQRPATPSSAAPCPASAPCHDLAGRAHVRLHAFPRSSRTHAAASSYGPIFVGVVFNIFLYGIMVTQTYLYFNTYKKYVLFLPRFCLLLILCQGSSVDEALREFPP